MEDVIKKIMEKLRKCNSINDIQNVIDAEIDSLEKDNELTDKLKSDIFFNIGFLLVNNFLLASIYIKLFEKSIDLDNDVDSLCEKCYSLIFRNLYQVVIRGNKKALNLNKKHHLALVIRAFILFYQGNLNESLKIINDPILEQSKDEKVQHLRGIIFDNSGRNNRALNAFKNLSDESFGAGNRERIRFEKGAKKFRFNIHMSLQQVHWWEKVSEKIPYQVKYWTSCWREMIITKHDIADLTTYIEDIIRILEKKMWRKTDLKLIRLLKQRIQKQFDDEHLIEKIANDLKEEITRYMKIVNLSPPKRILKAYLKFLLRCSKELAKQLKDKVNLIPLLNILNNELKKDEFCDPRKLQRVKKLTEQILARFLKKGYSRAFLKDIPTNRLKPEFNREKKEDYFIKSMMKKTFSYLEELAVKDPTNYAVRFSLWGLNSTEKLSPLENVQFYNPMIQEPNEEELKFEGEEEFKKEEITQLFAFMGSYIPDLKSKLQYFQARIEQTDLDAESAKLKARSTLSSILDFFIFLNMIERKIEFIPEERVSISNGNLQTEHLGRRSEPQHLQLTENYINFIKISLEKMKTNSNMEIFRSKLLNFIHWFNKGMESENSTEKIIFYWIALEFLIKEEKESGELVNLINKRLRGFLILSDLFEKSQDLYLSLSADYLTKFSEIRSLVSNINGLKNFPEDFSFQVFLSHLNEFLPYIEDPFLREKIDEIFESNSKSNLKLLVLMEKKLYYLILTFYSKRNQIIHAGMREDKAIKDITEYFERKLYQIGLSLFLFLQEKENITLKFFWRHWNHRYEELLKEILNNKNLKELTDYYLNFQ
ncbi:MAG: hypothetical protein ACTSRC_04565 [Candidatus Helarchaeota archaeon]